MSDERTVVVVDTETTGLEPGLDRPYEVAWQVVRIAGGSIVELGDIHTEYLPVTAQAAERVWLLPEAMCDHARRHLTGVVVGDSFVECAAREIVGVIFDEAKSGSRPPIWAGVNPGFDLSMLGLPTPQESGFHYTPWDVAHACRARMGLLPWESKTDVVMERAGIETTGRHTAAGDVRMTVQLIDWLLADFAKDGTR